MKSKVSLSLLWISFLLIFGCSKPEEKIDFEVYEGKSLHIGMIGEKPKIKEDNIRFTSIGFTDLQNIDNYDAIFITKENLKEADKSEYAAVYNHTPIPFLFFETTKSYVPFINEKLDLEHYPDVESGAYAYLYDSNSDKYWGYGLYNDEVNERNIQDAYSRIFKTIEEISQ